MKSKAKRVTIAVLLLTLLSALASTTARGMSVIRPSSGTYFDSKDPCARDDNGRCWVNGYLGDQPLLWNDPTLALALTNWNDGKLGNQRWTIVEGSPLPGTVQVTQFRTFDEGADGIFGGVEITAHYQPSSIGTDPLAGVTWYWAQAITLNYRPGPTTPHLAAPDPTITTMDDATFNTYPGHVVAQPLGDVSPIYPYQTGFFYDKPECEDHLHFTMFFHAEDFIVQANTGTHTLTVYEGFSYGWDFTCVPEPSSLVLLVIGVLSLFAYARRTRRETA